MRYCELFERNIKYIYSKNISESVSSPVTTGIWWHGSPSEDLRGGSSGLHIGTHEAAKQALEARIGVPADGKGWNGDREYGKTLLAGKKTLKYLLPYCTGFNCSVPDEDFYPTRILKYPNGSDMPMSVKPSIKPYRIIGPMTNNTYSPYDDFKANGYMSAQIKRYGKGKRGYYYKNVGEDSGSISAVVPNGDHLIPATENISESTSFSIAIKSLRLSKKSVLQALKDIKNGKLSKTNGPVIVIPTEYNQYQLVDGYHRVVEAILAGKTKIRAKRNIEYSRYYTVTKPEDVWIFDPNSFRNQ